MTKAAAAALLCALSLFLVLGHALHVAQMDEGEAMGAAAAICLVLFTVIAPLALALPALLGRALVLVSAPSPSTIRLPRPDSRVPQARASPAWLQRFLD